MKILLINYAYFVTGGPERYMFNVKNLLEKNGHEVIPFSIKSNDNIHSKYEKFFANSISSDGSWYYESSKNPKYIFKQLGRLFYSFHVKKKLNQLIKKIKPDVAYILQYHKKLSPSIIDSCKIHSIPIVVRLSDYLIMCPETNFFRDGRLCEDCKVSTFSSVKHKCVKNSRSATFLWWIANKIHWFIGSYDKIDILICTNSFMTKKIEEFYPKKFNINIVSTFVPDNKIKINDKIDKKNLFSFIGNITFQKGIITFLKAISLLDKFYKDNNAQVVIMGRDKIGLNHYIEKYGLNKNKIKLINYSTLDQVYELLQRTKFLVFPSNIYENLPNIVLESFNVQTPVISRNIGSLTSLINNNYNGLTYDKQDPKKLMELLYKGINMSELDYNNLQLGCKNTINNNYSESSHYNNLIESFDAAIKV